MSDILSVSLLKYQLYLLDRRIDRWCSGELGGRAGRWMRLNEQYVRHLYEVGDLRKEELPGPLLLTSAEIPLDLVDFSSPTPSVEIPWDVVLLKRGPGQPRKFDYTISGSLRCCERHAQRLAKSGKGRQRLRRKPLVCEIMILESHAERKNLLQRLRDEEATESLVSALVELCDADFYGEKLFWDLAEALKGKHGLLGALIVVGYANGKALSFAASVWKCSEATLRRRAGSHLRELQSVGRKLAEVLPTADLKVVALRLGDPHL